MRNHLQFYIDGQWVPPVGSRTLDVINPATEQVAGRIAMGDGVDVDRAVAAARRAFESYSRSSREQRLEILERLLAAFDARVKDLCEAVSEEMGSPKWLAEQVHVTIPRAHIHSAINVLKSFRFEELQGRTLVRKVPIGVCGLITPWNYPIAMMLAKTAPALAAGCTMVLKPSEFAPFTAQIFAEVVAAADVPPGVFNMVFGDGATVGTALSRHPGIDMVSITGSTRAGIEVARNAADTVKRVHQELGGKSPNVMLPDADLSKAVESGVRFILINSGQTCTAPSRLLVPKSRLAEAVAIAKATVASASVGAPDSGAFVGPLVNAAQWQRVQSYIKSGIDEGAEVVSGGLGKPEGLADGYYVRPTIFANVKEHMRVAREEIFGPVLVIQEYSDENDAVRIANDTPYGLAAYVHAGSVEKAASVGARIRAGQVYLNGDLNLFDTMAPFGGCKLSGNGREGGAAGFEAYLEEIAFLGYAPESSTQSA